MDLGTLRTELQNRGSSFIDDGRLDRWLNFAYQEINEFADWYYLETSASGAAPLTVTDFRAALSVTDATNQSQLWGEDRSTVLEVSGNDLTRTGSPEWFYVEGNQLKVFPVQAVTLQVRYLRVPPDLVEPEDTPILPSRYHLLLVDGAYCQALKDSNDSEQLQAMRLDYQASLQRMLTTLGARNGANPEQTLVRG